MRRILLSTLKILISAALLYFSLRKIDLSDLASRLDVSSLGWIGLAIAVTFLQIFVGVLRWREISAECGAPLADPAGDALQRDRNLLQPDTAVLDRRRRRAAVARRARRRRLARCDLFHLRRPRHRPDRARRRHRGEPALELPPDRRSQRQVGAAVRRFRSARRRPRISRARQVALAVAEALVGNASPPRLLGDRQPRDVQPHPRTESCGAVVARSRAHRRHRLVRGAIDRTRPWCSARFSSWSRR